MPTPEQQARFALERILTGPVVQEALVLPTDFHQQSLRMAQRDLAALPSETTRLLSDPALIERVTGPRAINLDPWDGLLDVLLALDDRPTSLVLAWTEPALQRRVPALLLKSVIALAALDDPAAGPTLMAILERSIDESEISRAAWNALARLPAPWPGRALERVHARGLPDLWIEVVAALEARLARGRPAAYEENLLAWWGLVADPGGPRGPTGMPRLKTLPWSGIGPLFDRAAPPPLPGARPGAAGIGPRTARASYGLGWLAAAPPDAGQRTVNELAVVGIDPAAEARCALARRGLPTYVASVQADRGSPVPLLKAKAEHCLMDVQSAPGAEALRAFWERHFADVPRVAAGEILPPTLGEMGETAARLPLGGTPEERAVLERVLRTDRPLATWQLLLERAYDRLASLGLGAEVDLTRSLIEHPDPAEFGVGLHLAQRARNPAYLPALEQRLAGVPAAQAGGLRRTLTWIYAGGGVEPGALEAFARRYAGWVDEADDGRAAGLATGLFDLGETGAKAFVERLAGPRQRVLVTMLQSYGGLLPTEVAEGLADRLGPDLPADLRHAVLVALWRSAPAAASSALAAAKGRLDPSERESVDVVLEVVRHRASVR